MPENDPTSVLIIEDDFSSRTLALQAFDGFNKITAGNAKDGYEKFKEHCPDITLLDIGLPDANGLDLLPELLNFDPEAFIVMLTASSVSTDVEEAQKRGASGYIIKPFTLGKVYECVSNYIVFKSNLNTMTPDERAETYIKGLRIDSLDKNISQILTPKEAKTVKKQIVKEDLKKLLNDSSKKSVGGLSAESHAVAKTWNILFVDDYETNRERARTKLQNLGCNVDIAKTSDETRKKVEKKDYNLIFLDAKLKPLDGYDTAKVIDEYYQKHSLKRKPVIIGMIESAQEIDNEFWIGAKMNDYIRKPTTFSMIKNMIENKYNYLLKKKKKNLLTSSY